MKQFVLITFSLLLSQMLYAQGIINITQDVAIEQALAKHKELNKATMKVDGWCVQIIATNDRQKVETLKSQLLQTYPGILVDWDYDRPFFKLRAGAYPTKLQAARLLNILKSSYPGSYITKGQFTPRSLL